MRQQGFTLLESVLALLVVGLTVTWLAGALSSQSRTLRLSRTWAQEEARATQVLMDELHKLELMRGEEARRGAMRSQGQDATLGPWEWRADLVESLPGQAVGLFRIGLKWRHGEVHSHAALRVS